VVVVKIVWKVRGRKGLPEGEEVFDVLLARGRGDVGYGDGRGRHDYFGYV